jgi:hypothetical protein
MGPSEARLERVSEGTVLHEATVSLERYRAADVAPMRLGRLQAANDVWLDSLDSVGLQLLCSRTHCHIRYDVTLMHFMLCPNHTTNGTWVRSLGGGAKVARL